MSHVHFDSLPSENVELEISTEILNSHGGSLNSDICAVAFLKDKLHRVTVGYNDSVPASLPSHHEHIYIHRKQRPTALLREALHWREIGRTECVKDKCNIHFSQLITMPYQFEEIQHVRIGLWKVDAKSQELDVQGFIGDIGTTLGNLVVTATFRKEISLPNLSNNGKLSDGNRASRAIIVIARASRDDRKILVKGVFSAAKLARTKALSSIDPYLTFAQVHTGTQGGESVSKLCRTEVVLRSRNPHWNPLKFEVDVPKGRSISDVSLRLICTDHRYDEEIGFSNFTLQDVLSAESFTLVNANKRGCRGRVQRGVILPRGITSVQKPSLVEYLQGGLKLHLNVAIDLTASNGDPWESSSLHFQGQDYEENQYVKSLRAIADVLQAYFPSGNIFDAYGFGAELPEQSGVCSPCFALNLEDNPKCHGVAGVITAYTKALNAVRLSGPTIFAPLIETVSRSAAQRQIDWCNQSYDVLLILTDGVMADYEATMNIIVETSHNSPLSIVIISVGNADYSRCVSFNSDEERLEQKAARGIVQLVMSRDHMATHLDGLASEALDGIPQNVVDYFLSSNPPIMPARPTTVPGGE